MYVPDHFKVSDRQEMLSFLQANAFGQLISVEDNRPTVSQQALHIYGRCRIFDTPKELAADHHDVIDNLDNQGSAVLAKAMRKALS